MNEALTKKLIGDFPKLFRKVNESALQRGFECGDGWFDLIYKLAQDIETAAHQNNLNPESDDWPICRQVKQKMGALHFVVFAVEGQAAMNDRISLLRTTAFNQSLKICEECGKHGQFYSAKVCATLCSDHAIKMMAEDVVKRPVS
jgi:hypothetical protein